MSNSQKLTSTWFLFLKNLLSSLLCVWVREGWMIACTPVYLWRSKDKSLESVLTHPYLSSGTGTWVAGLVQWAGEPSCWPLMVPPWGDFFNFCDISIIFLYIELCLLYFWKPLDVFQGFERGACHSLIFSSSPYVHLLGINFAENFTVRGTWGWSGVSVSM